MSRIQAPSRSRAFTRARVRGARKKYVALLEAPPLTQCAIRDGLHPERRSAIRRGGMKTSRSDGATFSGTASVGCASRNARDEDHPDLSRAPASGCGSSKRTLAHARAAHFVRVELDVHADNARAIALYRQGRLGWEGVVRDAVFIDGEYRDAISMAIVDARECGVKTRASHSDEVAKIEISAAAQVVAASAAKLEQASS